MNDPRLPRHEPDHEAGHTTGKIIVGVDGSECARRALAWAVDEARRRHTEVIAIHACPYPVLATSMEGISHKIPGPDFVHDAERLLADEITAVTGGNGDVPIERRVSDRSPAAALIRTSDGAELVVIGTRGYGGFTEALLGSVGQQVAHHAKCPVVIVR